MSITTDFVLFQISTDAMRMQGGDDVLESFRQFCANQHIAMTDYRIAYATNEKWRYFYAQLSKRTQLHDALLSDMQAAFEAAFSTSVRASRLELVFYAVGHSAAESPQFHYAVETDVDAGWMPEIARWYDTEHMPGLAAVPGCIHAMRLLNHDHVCSASDNRPLSFACYDLTSPDVLESAPWLAVRHTAWSDIARPHFKNTLRTMFGVVG